MTNIDWKIENIKEWKLQLNENLLNKSCVNLFKYQGYLFLTQFLKKKLTFTKKKYSETTNV